MIRGLGSVRLCKDEAVIRNTRQNLVELLSVTGVIEKRRFDDG